MMGLEPTTFCMASVRGLGSSTQAPIAEPGCFSHRAGGDVSSGASTWFAAAAARSNRNGEEPAATPRRRAL